MAKRRRMDKRQARAMETPSNFGGKVASQRDTGPLSKRSKRTTLSQRDQAKAVPQAAERLRRQREQIEFSPEGEQIVEDLEVLDPYRYDPNSPWSEDWQRQAIEKLGAVGGIENMGFMGDDGTGLGLQPPGTPVTQVDEGRGQQFGAGQGSAMADDGIGTASAMGVTADDGGGPGFNQGWGTGLDVRREGIEEIREVGGKGGITRPLLALDMHLDLINWLDTRMAVERRSAWWRGYYATRGISGNEQYEDFLVELVTQNVSREREMLDIAQTLYVGDEMLDLALAVADNDHPEPLRSTDPWCPCGIIFLAKPLHYWAARQLRADVVAEPLDIVAIGWATGGVGRKSPDGGWEPSLGLELWIYGAVEPLTDFINLSNINDGLPLHPHQTIVEFGPLPLMDSSAWAIDVRWEAATTQQEIEDVEQGLDGTDGYLSPMRTVPWLAKVRKLLKAIWRLLDQEIVAIEPAKIGRAGLRRSKRVRPRMDGDAVNIIHLRRIVDITTREVVPIPELAERLKPAHSWRVRSHWRHLQRGDGIISEDGSKILLDDKYHWRDCPALRVTDAHGRQERLRVRSYGNGWATLQWECHLRGMVEVERLALVGEYVKGIGLLIERYDVVDFSR